MGSAQSLAHLDSRRLRSSVRIAVLGAPGAGKTVFLTCLFQTIQEGIPIVSKVDGGYFEQRESEIRRAGACPPTEAPVLARFDIQTTPETAQGHDRLPVYLLDFPGRLFSDPERWGRGRSADDPLFGAEDFLIDCDAYIVLINSGYFSAHNQAPSENPFPRGVEFIVRHCSGRGTPLALVFTQRDSNTSLTMRQVEEFPVVKRFRRLFSSDPAAAQEGGRPFGFIRLLNCYEGSPGEAPRRRDRAGGIWGSAAAKTFEAVFRAAWPRVQGRLEPPEVPPVPSPAPAVSRRKGRRSAAVAIMLLMGILGAIALFLWGGGFWDRRFIGQALQSGRRGEVTQLSADQRRRLHRLLEERSIPDLEAILKEENASDSEFFETEMRLLMAGWLMEAAARREEELIRGAAADLLTAAQPRGRRRLDDLVGQFRRARTVEENRKLLGGLAKLIKALDALAPSRRKAARLLDSLSNQRSARAWRHVLQVLRRGYLFELKPLGQSGDSPLSSLERLEKAESASLRRQAVDQLVQHPIYRQEVEVLASWVRFRDLALRTVRWARSDEKAPGTGDTDAPSLRREVERYRLEAPTPSLDQAFDALQKLLRRASPRRLLVEPACQLLDLRRGDCG